MKKNPRKGHFIVFEGIDGAGTTTQSGLLLNHLKSKNKQSNPKSKKSSDPVLTSEPWTSPAGELARNALKNKIKISNAALQLLFCADRADHLEYLILPSLEKGKTVICDRYFYSTLVFGEISDLSRGWLRDVNKDFLKPDICFWLHCPPRVALERIKKRQVEKEKFEEVSLLGKAENMYKKISTEFPEIVTIDATQKPEEILAEVKLHLQKKPSLK